MGPFRMGLWGYVGFRAWGGGLIRALDKSGGPPLNIRGPIIPEIPPGSLSISEGGPL